jgi:hypothetical protein
VTAAEIAKSLPDVMARLERAAAPSPR